MLTALNNRAGLAALMITLLLAAVAAGCAQPETADETEADEKAVQTEPIQITDDRGVEVQLAEAPKKVVSIGPSNTEILFAVGAGQLVIGADTFSDWPAEPLDQVQEVGSLQDPDIEQIAGLQPDLIIASTTGLEAIEKLEELDLVVAGFDPQGLDHTYRTIDRIGQLTQRQGEAERLTSAMKEAFDCIREEIGEVEDSPAVFFEISPDPIWTTGADTFVDEMIELAGGSNIFGDLEQAWAEVDPELVIERDPAVVLTGMQQTVEMIDEGQRPGWQEISAVSEGRVAVLDTDLLHRPGPRLVLGFTQLAGALWPHLPDEPDCVSEYRSQLQQWSGK